MSLLVDQITPVAAYGAATAATADSVVLGRKNKIKHIRGIKIYLLPLDHLRLPAGEMWRHLLLLL